MRLRTKINICIAAFLLVFWFSGLAGLCLSMILNGLALPIDVSDEVEISAVRRDNSVPVLEEGADLRISSDRLDEILSHTIGWKRALMPPGMLRHGLMIEAVNTIELPEGGFVYFPLRITIDDAFASPLLRILVRDDFLNDMLKDSDILGRREKRKEWIFGHYDRKNFKQFDTLRIYTVPVHSGSLITVRKLAGEATGWVRYKFEDTLIGVRTTARVKRMVLDGTLSVEHEREGIRMNYRINVPELDGDFNNVAPQLDDQFSESLRKSFEKSLNKEKRTRRLQSVLFPGWIPLDSNIDMRLVP